MTERKISMKDRIRLGWEKIKMYPKIWVSSLAVLCLLLGFVGGMSAGAYNSRDFHPREGMHPMEHPAFQDEGQQKMTPPDSNRSQNDNQKSSSNDDSSNSSENGFETETN